METIGFIGAGNMAGALISGICSAGVFSPADIFVSDIDSVKTAGLAKKYGVRVAKDNCEASAVDIVVCAVKPQIINQILPEIASNLKPDSIVVSIAAGVKISAITKIVGDIAVVRVMPNTPALIGEGVSVLCANEKAKPSLDKLQTIFAAVGSTHIIDDETLMDAVTAVSGSGPAYFFLMMEVLAQAGAAIGLDAKLANQLAISTAKGAAMLAVYAATDGIDLSQLRRNVTSPGGTTEAALKVFDEKGFGKIVAAAVKAAADRSKELSS